MPPKIYFDTNVLRYFAGAFGTAPLDEDLAASGRLFHLPRDVRGGLVHILADFSLWLGYRWHSCARNALSIAAVAHIGIFLLAGSVGTCRPPGTCGSGPWDHAH